MWPQHNTTSSLQGSKDDNHNNSKSGSNNNSCYLCYNTVLGHHHRDMPLQISMGRNTDMHPVVMLMNVGCGCGYMGCMPARKSGLLLVFALTTLGKITPKNPVLALMGFGQF